MGTYTLEVFRDEVRYVCGGIAATSPALTNDRLDRRINDAYRFVCNPNHYRHPELETTENITLVAGDAIYALTNTYYMIYGVSHVEAVPTSITDATRRTKLRPSAFRDQMTIERTESLPRVYSYWGNQLHITCIPTASAVGQTLQVHGYIQPTALTAGTTTVIKDDWDLVIVLGAEWLMWVSLNEADRAYEAKANFGQMLNEVADFRRLHAEEWDWQTGADITQHMRMG